MSNNVSSELPKVFLQQETPSIAALKTDETYTTDICISNSEFMQAVFHDLDNARPIVVSFPGNPRKNKKWNGFPYLPQDVRTNPSNNNYFSLASFSPDEDGTVRRRKKNFHALHAFFLDDVGTKVDPSNIALIPSWKIETSPGSFQWGYILETPLMDLALADQIMQGIISANLSDPGAGGPSARIIRLPSGSHGKCDPAFPCRLVYWKPDLKYSIDALVEGLGIAVYISNDGKTKKSPMKKKAKPTIDEDAVFIPAAQDNPVVESLKLKGLYKTLLEPLKHDIICPWVHEHTDEADTGTGYFEPDDSHPVGGFHCFHGHCSERKIVDLLDFLHIDISAARMKPVIRLIGGEIHRAAEAAEKQLAERGHYFQRAGCIVFVDQDQATGDISIKDVKPPGLLTALAKIANWERYSLQSREWVRIDPSDRVVSMVFSADKYRFLPALNGLAYQPYLRPDGSIVSRSGFDTESCIYSFFNENEFSTPVNPNLSDALVALNALRDLMSECAFASVVDESAALSAILTAVIRPSLPLAPMFHICAHSSGSGKSFLCQLISTFATPKIGSALTFPDNDQECNKMLLAELLRGPAVIEFDNLTTDILPHNSLCTTLTSESKTGRILGVSKTVSVGTRALFLSSGNNVRPIKDMARRCLTIDLDPGVENPVERIFKRPYLLRNLREHRALYVRHALTIILAWISAGRPCSTEKQLVTYKDWSDLCCEPLIWLGLPNPAKSAFESVNDDPDKASLSEILNCLHEIFGNKPVMVRNIIDHLEALGSEAEVDIRLREALLDVAGQHGTINRRILGHWLKRQAGGRIGSLRLSRTIGSRSAMLWRVESVV